MATYDYRHHNWATEVVMQTAWLTQVDASHDRLAETRRILLGAPRRTLNVRYHGLSREQSTKLYFELYRMGNEARRIPLYQDVAVTTASSSSTTINCPTSYRRFYDGELVLIVSADGATYEFATISSSTASAITTSGSLSTSYAAGSLVYPVLTTEVLLESEIMLLTDRVSELAATYVEAEPTLAAAGTYGSLTSYGFQQIDSLAYLLPNKPEWRSGVRVRMARAGQQHLYGRHRRIKTVGPRPVLVLDLTFSLSTRSDFWDLLRFFDAHRGRGAAFWIENPMDLWEPAAVSTTYLDVTAVGALADYTNFVKSIDGGSPFLFIEKTDGTKILVQVTGVTEPGGGVFRLAATIPSMSLSDIAKAGLAFYVRFAEDVFTERWHTVNACDVSLSVVELLRHENETSTAGNDGFFSGGVGQLCS